MDLNCRTLSTETSASIAEAVCFLTDTAYWKLSVSLLFQLIFPTHSHFILDSLVQSTSSDATLTKTQKITYGVVTVGGQYFMERLNRVVTAQGWGELPEVRSSDIGFRTFVPTLGSGTVDLTCPSPFVNRTTSRGRHGISFRREEASFG
jgi:hypothetical protein